MFNKSELFTRYPVLAECQCELNNALNILIESYSSGGKLLVMGNGGSSADAEHLCGELVKGFVLKRQLTVEQAKVYDQIDGQLACNLQNGLPAISLGVAHSLISAFSNDLSWDYVFAQQVHVLGNTNDVVFGISTSGNSPNVVNGLKVAKSKAIKTISLTGQADSLCSEISDVVIKVPSRITHYVQELHLPIYHALALELEYHFYDS